MGQLHVLRLGSRAEAVFFRAVDGGVNGVAFSEGSDRVVAPGGDGAVRVFDTEGRLLARMAGHDGAVPAAVFDGENAVISVGNDGTARRWSLDGLERQLTGHVPTTAGGVAFEEDSRVTLVEGDASASTWVPDGGVRPLLPPIGSDGALSAAVERGFVAAGLLDARVVVRDGIGRGRRNPGDRRGSDRGGP